MLSQDFVKYLQTEVKNVKPQQAAAVIELTKEGATVPFIARYRKEKTGNLDEVQVRDVIHAHETFEEIIKRQAFMLKEIESQGNLTNELKANILGTFNLGELDEIYRPFKKKKKTKATLARDAGLEPLAEWIWGLGHGTIKDEMPLEVKAKEFINAAAKFVTYDEVLKGAQDILVEKLTNNPALREFVRDHLVENGRIVSVKGKEYKAHSKFEMYADFKEPIKSLASLKASHRYLAMRRGWEEAELTLTIEGDTDLYLKKFSDEAMTTPSQATDLLKKVATTALDVHVLPSIHNEVHRRLKELADNDAILVFAENVRQVLLSSPFGAKCVLGVDPGLRTGCKVALVGPGGNFISHTVLHIQGDGADQKVEAMFAELLKTVTLDAVAVGNGTGGREAESFLRKIFQKLGANVPVIMVNEAGASVYSASDVAREEFPDLDLTVRGAISIARRLQDPLSELVKIDPKSIGVGQYQHDVGQPQLKKSLDAVVESCVNSVGVDLNTSSQFLLGFVSGIGPALAKNIVEYRKGSGLFEDRDALMKVPRFSSKVFEQCAGFLRLPTSKNPLDKTGIHPERYSAVREMCHDAGVTLSEVIGNKDAAQKLLSVRQKWADLVGEFTFDDIVKELEKPGRDPRDPFKVFSYRDDIFEVKDLKEGMICPGLVSNVTNFGAFVDIGVHQDGLVHISELTHEFVDDPRKVVKPGQQVTVKVMKVDFDKNQISLTMKLEPAPMRERPAPRPQREAAPPRGPRPSGGPRADGPRDSRPRAPGSGPRTGAAPRPGGPPRDDKRAGDRDQRPDHRNDNRGGNRGPHQGQRPTAGKPFTPKSPFNNAFGGLASLKDQLNKK